MLRADGLINTRPFGARLRSLEHLLELQVCEKRAVQDELGACQLLLKEVRVKVGKRGTCQGVICTLNVGDWSCNEKIRLIFQLLEQCVVAERRVPATPVSPLVTGLARPPFRTTGRRHVQVGYCFCYRMVGGVPGTQGGDISPIFFLVS
jgi:hypothetical protein